MDYMHLVCIGVVKKLIRLWLTGKVPIRLPYHKVSQLSSALVQCKAFITNDFARKPRPVQDVGRWKATECRQFLLYTGPVVLQSVLDKVKYVHFLNLHVAMTILLNKDMCDNSELVSYANKLLVSFVLKFASLYDKKFISHNVHGLIHLAVDVSQFGVLDNVSAFRFENYLQKVKKLVRKGEKPLQQLVKRYYEIAELNQNKSPKGNHEESFTQNHVKGPVLNGLSFPQYCKYTSNTSTYSNRSPNNVCLLKNGLVVEIHNFAFSPIEKEMFVVCKKYCIIGDVYQNPLPSSCLNIFYIKPYKSRLHSKSVNTLFLTFPVSQISLKYLKLPFKSGFAVVPISHSMERTTNNILL